MIPEKDMVAWISGQIASCDDDQKRENLSTLLAVISNFDQFERRGLSGGITMEVLVKLRDFCVSEKEIYTEKTYKEIADKDQAEQAFADADMMHYYQDAEVYVMMLITIEKSRR